MGVLSEFPPAQVFIETGLGSGRSLQAALAQPFERLHSIEIDEALIARCGLVDPRLTLHHGSSPEVLPRIIDSGQTTLFWLDAHYSDGLYTGDGGRDRARVDPRYGQCPLLAELAIIRGIDWAVRPWIYIDDADCFTAEAYQGSLVGFDRAQFPREAEVRAWLPDGYRLETIDMRGLAYRATPEERA